MSTPQTILFAFALWTIMVPLSAVAVYRWSRILAGVQGIHTFRSDAVEGADWYRRAMRAHANCVENLPVLGVIVWTLTTLGVDAPLADALAVIFLAGRIGQSLVHILFTETARTVSVRFAFFFAQVLCMLGMSGQAVAAWAGA